LKVLAVASKLHGLEYVSGLVERLESVLRPFGLHLDNVITDESELSSVEKDRSYAIFLLTGGTSRLVRSLDARMEGPSILLISHPYHNSMPSALSARSRLEADGKKNVAHIHIKDLSDREVEKVVKIVDALNYIERLRILYVGRASDEVDVIKNIVEDVVVVNIDDLGELLDSVNVDDTDIKKILSVMDLSGANKSLVKEPLKLYMALKSLMKDTSTNSLAIDCFPFIVRYGYTPCVALSLLLDEGIPAACEADLRSLLLLAMAQKLTGLPGWIFNPSDYDDGKLLGAHCTVATKLTKYSTLVPHFESGNPYAVTGTLERGTYTVAAISPDFTKMSGVEAELISSGMLSGGRCRTQAVLRLNEKDPRPFIEKSVSNHHVLMKGNVLEELKILSRMLGMEFIEY